MSLSRFAVVMARLFGLGYTFQGLVFLTYLPDRLYAFFHASPERAAGINIEMRLLVLRCVLYVMFGSALWIWSKPLADKLVENLGDAAGRPDSPPPS